MRKITPEVIAEMKLIIDEVENPKPSTEEDAYLETVSVKIKKEYNPNYGDDRICECGHVYYRHFDSYERMENVGCKYCQCYDFKEKK